MQSVRRHSERKKQGQGGFTLIELVAVLVVLGVLASIALPRFQDIQGKAEKSGAAASLASEASAEATRQLEDWEGTCSDVTIEGWEGQSGGDGDTTGAFRIPGDWSNGFGDMVWCEATES